MIRTTACALLLGLALAALPAHAAGEAPTTTVLDVEGELATMNVTDRSNRPPVFPSRESIEMASEMPEGAPALPEGISGALYGTKQMIGRTVTFALGKSGEDVEGYDRLAADLDGDGTFADSEVLELPVRQRPLRDGGVVLQAQIPEITIESDGREYRLMCGYGYRVGTPVTLNVMPLWYLRGSVTVGDVACDVFVVDGDLDGDFDGGEDGWVLRATPEEGARTGTVSSFGLSRFDEKRFREGRLLELRPTEGLSLKLTVTPADAPDPASLKSHRERVEHEWMERFDKERDRFIEARGVDTSRPKAETPIDWNFVTFDEAKAMAKAAGKPLFVDVLAYWCVWCYRMDYYTYPDAEVAKLLNESFVPVKIIQEQDRAGDYARIREELGARGIPAMGIWTADGDLVRYIRGWKKPSEFVEELKAGLEGEGE